MTHIQKILGITGWKNSGKTTLTERLVSDLVAKGYRIATVKHAHHAFDIDHEGRDSWRHRKAGALEVAIVSSTRWAIIHELEGQQEPPLQAVLSKLAPCDLVIVEGYKREGHLKIEVRRKDAKDNTPLAMGDPSIVAIAADYPISGDALPIFDIDNIETITSFVISKFLQA